jgi:hypothetical protein
MAGKFGKAQAFLRERGPGLALEVCVNFLLPLIIYDLSKAKLGDVHALMASSAPPILWSIIEFIRHRRVDALSIIVLAGIGLSLLAYFGGGGAKFLQLREKLVTTIIGLGFVVSVLIRRPLIYELARATMRRRGQTENLAEFEGLKDNPGFRRTMNLMTLVWGVGLLADAAVGAGLVMALSIHDYLIASPILGYSTMGGLSLWTYWYARRARARGRALRAAEEAAAAPTGQAAGEPAE